MDTQIDTAAAVIDWNQLHSLRELQAEGDPDVVAQVVAMFQEDSAARVARACEALESGDAKGLRLEAHSIRGSAGMIGASVLCAAAAAVEHRAESAAPVEIRPLVDVMIAAVADALGALRHEPGQHSSTQ
jgi:HPt (histidine-containing phosphotransfer) domain-containing protein